RAGPPLAPQPAAADEPQAVLARDRPAEPKRHREQVVGRPRGASELFGIVRGQQERGVQIPVADVAPAAGGKPSPAPDAECLLHRFLDPVERHGDVLAELRAQLCRDREGDAVAPAPEVRDLLLSRRGTYGERALAEYRDDLVAQACRFFR